jgi:multidrug resistance efflux pump|nr:HlyD family efflux transporter periplasmic adaptor subunit [Kofleriaceae bacterium]
MNSKLRTALIAAVPAAAIAYVAIAKSTAPAAAADAPVIQRSSELIAPGRVEPTHDPVALAFETTGRIVDIAVDDGDAVTAGQVVARLDDRMAKARVASATAAVDAATARYAMARRGARSEDLAAARAEADAAAADAEHRSVEQARSSQLGSTGALASSAVDADVTAARVAHANADAAAARYRALANGTRVEQVQEAAAEVASAKADLDQANVALDQTVLRAPGNGVVLRRMAEVGAFVTTMSPLTVVTVADVGKLELRAELDEADVARVTVDLPAYATADAYGDRKFPLHVTRITRELGRKTVRDDDPRAKIDTRVLEVVARFDQPAELPLGLRMTIHVGD